MRLEHRKRERPSRSTLAKCSTAVLPQGCLPMAIRKLKCSLDAADFVRHIPYPVTALGGYVPFFAHRPIRNQRTPGTRGSRAFSNASLKVFDQNDISGHLTASH